MVASKLESSSEIDKEVDSNPIYRLVHPSRGIVPIFREGLKTMSGSVEAAQAATGSQGESSPENRTPTCSSAADKGDARRAENTPVASAPQSTAFMSAKERPAYLIKWSRFEDQLSNAFAELFCSEHFADVTLACDGGDVLKAHKIILAMSSPFFRRIFIDTPCKHPIVVLKEFSVAVMRNILQYLYMGKVVLNENEISGFMDAADFFGICGVIPDHYSCDIFATTLPDPQQMRHADKESHSQSHSDTDAGLPDSSRTSENENDEANENGEGRSMSEQDERHIVSHSPVIKYHGIKQRWTRRYSNTSFPGVSTNASSSFKEHKRSASAGEVESVPRSMDSMSDERARPKLPRLGEGLMESNSNLDSLPVEEEKVKTDPSSELIVEERQRKIIQRAYPTPDFNVNSRDSIDVQYNEWKAQGQIQNTYIPPVVNATTSQRIIRPSPYILGAKDFSHPLQVSVDTPKQLPLYGVPPTSSGVVDPAKSKTHPGLALNTSPQQMRNMLRQEPEANEYSTKSPTMSIMPPNHNHVSNDERAPLRYRPLSSGSSTVTSPTAFRQEYMQRPHFSLLSGQGWPFQDDYHLQHRHRHRVDESSRESVDRRYRSDSLDRGLDPIFSNAHHLRTMANKPHSYPAATDLSVPASRQYPLGLIPQLRSPSASSTGTSATRPKTKAIRSSQVPQSSRYTAAEVDQMVDAVANYPGNIVPCTLCQKFVKRERLRAHIHECHLLTGEKIICPHCGIALKSKGSFRVHIWRHKRGALPTRSTMSDFDGGRPPSPSHTSGPASH